jgi:hypothetical protein
MTSMLDTAARFFAESDWPFEQHAHEPLLRLQFDGENASFVCYAQVIEDKDAFVFYALFPDAVPADRRPAVAELITRLNYGLTIGNFELDFGDGEVRYRASVDVEDTELQPELIKPLAAAAVLNMDYYIPGIRAVVRGDATPAEAFTSLEGTA